MYNGSKLSRMTYNGNVMNFTYDAAGTPLTIEYNGTVYYYVTNLQGDIVAILNSSGSAVVNYVYNAWGGVSHTGPLADTLGNHNPLCYRGYVFDPEYKLYYLESRYYNAGLGRFQNADTYISTGQGLLGNNMFAYCNNNPVIYLDPDGNTCVMTCSGDINLLVRDLSGFHSAIGGGSGGGGLITETPKRSGALSVKEKSVWGGTKNGKVLPWEYDILSISDKGFTVIDASVSLVEGSLEREHFNITFFRCFSAEASAGITTADGMHVGIMASMLSADATFSLWIFEVGLVGYVGAVGGSASLNVDGFSAAWAPSGFGGGISIRWDLG